MKKRIFYDTLFYIRAHSTDNEHATSLPPGSSSPGVQPLERRLPSLGPSGPAIKTQLTSTRRDNTQVKWPVSYGPCWPPPRETNDWKGQSRTITMHTFSSRRSCYTHWIPFANDTTQRVIRKVYFQATFCGVPIAELSDGCSSFFGVLVPVWAGLSGSVDTLTSGQWRG